MHREARQSFAKSRKSFRNPAGVTIAEVVSYILVIQIWMCHGIGPNEMMGWRLLSARGTSDRGTPVEFLFQDAEPGGDIEKAKGVDLLRDATHLLPNLGYPHQISLWSMATANPTARLCCKWDR
jgi:hypothetical protein